MEHEGREEGKTVAIVKDIKTRREKDERQWQDLLHALEFHTDRVSSDPWQDILDAGIVEIAAQMSAKRDDKVIEHVASWFSELSPYAKGSLRTAIREERKRQQEAGEGKTRKPKQQDANYEDYVNLFGSVLGPIKRDLFSDELVHYCLHARQWQPVLDEEDRLKGDCEVVSGSGFLRFRGSLVKPYLARLKAHTTPTLCLDIPPWDGRDRLAELSDALVLVDRSSQGAWETQEGGDSEGEGEEEGQEVQQLTPELVRALVKDWAAKAWARIWNPKVRNRILLLKGGQNIGKDWWLSALTGGFGQWAADLQVSRVDKDIYLQLSSKAVLNVAEFDRTMSWEASVIKDLVTKQNTDIRASYGRVSKTRQCRASFVASVNTSDFLRDYTGNTRFIILEVERIAWDYPSSEEDRSQILAQIRELGRAWASTGELIGVSKEKMKAAEAVVGGIIAQATPTNPAEDAWIDLSQDLLARADGGVDEESRRVLREGVALNIWAEESFDKIAKRYGMNPYKLRRKIAANFPESKVVFGSANERKRGFRLHPSVDAERARKPVGEEDIDILF